MTRQSGFHGRQRLTAVLLIVVLGACGGAPEPAPDTMPQEPPTSAGDPLVAFTEHARVGIDDFSAALQRTLAAAMAEGGPVAAIEVCRVSAPSIAEVASAEHDVILARTALRVRNADNLPDAFEREVLERFAAAADAGAPLPELEYSAVVEDEGGRQFRFMKAIPMRDQPCGICHGQQIPADVRAVLAETYPDDAATGFAGGELRGAFSVRRRLP